MRNGVELVEIIDSYLEGTKTSRRQFCEQIGIPNSTVASWKSKNILPNAELLVKVAGYMNVSVDWLISGEGTNPLDDTFGIRNDIRQRLSEFLKENFEYKTENPLENMIIYNPQLMEFVSEFVNPEIFKNWCECRTNIPDSVFKKIADKLHVSLTWLLTGEEETDQVIDTHLYKLAKNHAGVLKGFDALDKADQDFIDTFITSKLELRKTQREAKLGQK